MLPDFESDQVLVRNDDSKPYRLKWKNRWHTITPGDQRYFPAVAAHLWFGDWNLQDHPTDRGLRPRSDERRRVFRKWGIGISEGNYLHKLPKITVINDATGEELPTIVADPDNKKADPEAVERLDRQAVLARMNQLEVALDQVKRMADSEGIELDLGGVADMEPASDDDGDVTPDPGEESDIPVGNEGRSKPKPKKAPTKAPPRKKK